MLDRSHLHVPGEIDKSKDSCSESLSWLEAEGYTATRVEIRKEASPGRCTGYESACPETPEDVEPAIVHPGINLQIF